MYTNWSSGTILGSLVCARWFINAWNAQGPAHHCAIGIGHITGKIEKLGAPSGMETVRIC